MKKGVQLSRSFTADLKLIHAKGAKKSGNGIYTSVTQIKQEIIDALGLKPIGQNDGYALTVSQSTVYKKSFNL